LIWGIDNAGVLGVLLMLISFRFLSNVLGFTSSMIFVNNSVHTSKLGITNGLALMCASLARACGPFLTGAIWSWTATYGSILFLSLSSFFFLPSGLNDPIDSCFPL